NLMFELGLFIGKLGRDRAFYIQQQGLKLPTDLLGIESPKFLVPAKKEDLNSALGPGCSKIADAISQGIEHLPSLPKLNDEQRAGLQERKKFSNQIAGAWWEPIRLKGIVQALSFFTIKPDEAYDSVRLDGAAYGDDGCLRAK